MTLHGNQQLPNNHFRKDWQRRVRTWFDQPARKERRRLHRAKRAASIAPRPTSLLRPAIRCPGLRYNIKIREGRGFTFEELKKAGFEPKKAAKLGIAVDHRRRNSSEESLALNVDRLQQYKAKLIIFPRKVRQKKGEEKMVLDKPDLTNQQSTVVPSVPLPVKAPAVTEGTVDDSLKSESQYVKLRKARSDARLVGKREKRAKLKAEEEAAKGKK